jgi:NitT/TauT family transport system substrate-binding protein
MKQTLSIRKSGIMGLLMVLLMMAGLPTHLFAQKAQPASALKVALLPILDTLPFHAAQAKGYFKRYGVSVTAVPVGSGLERDQLMQSGAIDGMLNEMGTDCCIRPESLSALSLISPVIRTRKRFRLPGRSERDSNRHLKKYDH